MFLRLIRGMWGKIWKCRPPETAGVGDGQPGNAKSCSANVSRRCEVRAKQRCAGRVGTDGILQYARAEILRLFQARQRGTKCYAVYG